MSDQSEPDELSTTRASTAPKKKSGGGSDASAAKSTKAKTSTAKTSKPKSSKAKTSKAKTSTAKTSKPKSTKAKTSTAKASAAKTSTAKTSTATASKPKSSKAKATTKKTTSPTASAKGNAKKSTAGRPRKKSSSSVTETALKEFTDGTFDMGDVQAGLALLLDKVGPLLGDKGLLVMLSKFVMPTRSVGIELFPQEADEIVAPPTSATVDEIAAHLPSDLSPEDAQKLAAAMEWLRAGAPATPVSTVS